MNSKYESVIGLEVHAQLSTQTKIFCSCSTKFGNEPNSNICPICLGHPGVLPVLNKKVVEYAVKLGLATNCNINQKSIFARKNYFYPDLPKGYQTSQFELPICENGYLEVSLPDGSKKKLGITRIHMEEDAGKSIHDTGSLTSVDVNRCGVPLLEIVSEPDMRNTDDVIAYLTLLRQTVRYLGICDGNMEEGSLRCDANVSVRLKGDPKLGTRTEIKNLNSFSNVAKAIEYEVSRQIELIEDGGKVIQETLLWDADNQITYSMRGKEDSQDYRYFPCPDLMPLNLDSEFIDQIKNNLPELPNTKFQRFMEQYGLPEYDAKLLTAEYDLANYFEEVSKITSEYKLISNWILGEVSQYLNESKSVISNFPISADNLGKLILLIAKGTISNKIAKEVFAIMIKENKDPNIIVKEKNLVQISNTSELEKIIKTILENNPNEVNAYLGGKEKVIGFFVGQIMRETKGKANPGVVNKLLKEKLEELR